jgi:hypothetical protein
MLLPFFVRADLTFDLSTEVLFFLAGTLEAEAVNVDDD